MIALLVALVIVGVLLGAFPMDDRIRRVIVAVIVIAVLLWLLEGFGVYQGPTFGHGRWFR